MTDSIFSGIIFLKFFVLGAIFGLIYEVCKLFKIISKNNIFIVNTIKCIYFCILGTYFCSFLLKNCDGSIQVYTIIAVILGIIIEQICIGFFFTRFYKLVYNVSTKILGKLKSTKLGNKILR